MWSQSGTVMGVISGCLVLDMILRFDKDIMVIVRKKFLRDVGLKQSRRT